MIGKAGLSQHDLKGIALTHGHEDHDGGLMDLVRRTGLPAWVHPIYRRLCRSYPEHAPHPSKKNFSASCWHCFMPESFTRAHCADYHRNRIDLVCVQTESPPFPLDSDVMTHHLPGHCPDGLAFQIAREALIVGDNLLPEITPHPTQEAFFQWTEKIIPAEFDRPEKVYGLRAYLASLKKLRALGREHPGMIVLPAHRLFHDGIWRHFGLEQRSAEIIEHHVQRCGSIVALLKGGPRTVEELVLAHFEPRLLKGFGIKMAEGEVRSHLELLEFCGDVEWNGRGAVVPTGTTRFEGFIREMMEAE
jgi:glyoxylase-like metal-dependent hydrolase (beta-lactamase superfamily II)